MTNRLFSGLISTLQFVNRVRDKGLGEHYQEMQAWRQIHAMVNSDQAIWDHALNVSEEVVKLTKCWAQEAMSERQQRINYKRQPDVILVVDACEKGWGALIMRKGVLHTAAGLATHSTWKHSSVWEPWGWYYAMNSLIKANESVLLLTDNEPLMYAVNKGHARGWHYNEVVRRTKKLIPTTQWHCEHIPGQYNIADQFSRGESISPDRIGLFEEALKVYGEHYQIIDSVLRDIGDLSGRTLPYRQGIHAISSLLDRQP
jgi:hypothetical protein